MKRLQANFKRILLIVAVIVVVVLMMDFNNRMSEYLRLNAQREDLSQQVTALVSTKESVVTQIAYATSDAAVEAWAREEAHMIRPGDIPVVAKAPANATPVPTQMAAPTIEVVENWQVWYALFLGESNP